MRTKALLLAAAATVAGIASIQAQSNVYSVNVVGYVNLTIPGKSVPAGRFQMIANQFVVTNTDVSVLIPKTTTGLTDGSQAFQWTGTGFGVIRTFEGDATSGEWDGPLSLNLGEGYFFKNNNASPVTITLVGEVPQGNRTNVLASGYSIRSSIVPQGGGLTSVLGFPVASLGDNGSQVLQWTGTGYGVIRTVEGGEYDGPEPVIAVGEGFFVRNNGAPINWVRNFSVQ